MRFITSRAPSLSTRVLMRCSGGARSEWPGRLPQQRASPALALSSSFTVFLWLVAGKLSCIVAFPGAGEEVAAEQGDRALLLQVAVATEANGATRLLHIPGDWENAASIPSESIPTLRFSFQGSVKGEESRGFGSPRLAGALPAASALVMASMHSTLVYLRSAAERHTQPEGIHLLVIGSIVLCGLGLVVSFLVMSYLRAQHAIFGGGISASRPTAGVNRSADSRQRPTAGVNRSADSRQRPRGTKFDASRLESNFDRPARDQTSITGMVCIQVPQGKKITLVMPSMLRPLDETRKLDGVRLPVSDIYANQLFTLTLRTSHLQQHREKVLLMGEEKNYREKIALELFSLSKKKLKKFYDVWMMGVVSDARAPPHVDIWNTKGEHIGSFARDTASSGSLVLKELGRVLVVTFENAVCDRKAKLFDPATMNNYNISQSSPTATTDPKSSGGKYYNVQCYHPADLVLVVAALVALDRLAV